MDVVATVLSLFVGLVPSQAVGSAVALRDPAPASCAFYDGTARVFRLPALEDLEVFSVRDRAGDGRTFRVLTQQGGPVGAVGTPTSWGRNMKPTPGWTEWVGIDRGRSLTLTTKERGRIRFEYCITRVD